MNAIVTIYIEDELEECSSASLMTWIKQLGLSVDELHTIEELSEMINKMDEDIYVVREEGYVVLCDYPLSKAEKYLQQSVSPEISLQHDMGIYYSQDKESSGPVILEIAIEDRKEHTWQWKGGHFTPMLDLGYDADAEADTEGEDNLQQFSHLSYHNGIEIRTLGDGGTDSDD